MTGNFNFFLIFRIKKKEWDGRMRDRRTTTKKKYASPNRWATRYIKNREKKRSSFSLTFLFIYL
jgi:hypothetical protein